MKNFDVDTVIIAWTSLVESFGSLKAIESKEDLHQLIGQMDVLLDLTRGNESHPLLSLVALMGDLVEAYETRELEQPDASPIEVLRLLMSSNGLKQKDLAKEFGGQSVVSQVLSGRRDISSRQAGALAVKFGVSAAAFIARPSGAEVPAAATEVGPSEETHQLSYGRRKAAITRSNARIENDQSLRAEMPHAPSWSPEVIRMSQSKFLH